jgi:hypothetical protein
MFPHLDHEAMPDHSMASAEQWAAGISGPAYAIDDETAIKVVDGTVEVVSEAHWKLFTPQPGGKLARLRRRAHRSAGPACGDVTRGLTRCAERVL